MRAATAIVGAIAVASILIALAFILSGGGDSAATVRTTVTEEIVRAPETEQEPATERSTGGEGGSPGFGGPKECGGGEYTVENVSCEIGAQIREGYEEGGRGELLAEDQEAGETITMSCAGTAPVECKGPGSAKVYFGG